MGNNYGNNPNSNSNANNKSNSKNDNITEGVSTTLSPSVQMYNSIVLDNSNSDHSINNGVRLEFYLG
jgi:hypothetical protein